MLSADNATYQISWKDAYLGLGANNAAVLANLTSTDAGTNWKLVKAANIDLFNAKIALYKLIVVADGLVTAATDGSAKTALNTALATATSNYSSQTTADDINTSASALNKLQLS